MFKKRSAVKTKRFHTVERISIILSPDFVDKIMQYRKLTRTILPIPHLRDLTALQKQNVTHYTVRGIQPLAYQQRAGHLVRRILFSLSVFVTKEVNILFTIKDERWAEPDVLEITPNQVIHCFQRELAIPLAPDNLRCTISFH
uniref:Uncharacterized protein n=2 Tax=Enterobacterales TaxID=91347 RepID=A0A7L8KBD8_ECOLX|nr:hypothetical protein [Escherichia coli]BAB93738.1 hypothetical protein [Proteus vulgaris]